jgi:hypothetical protein
MPLPSVPMRGVNAVVKFQAVTALTNGVGFVDAIRSANPTLAGLTVWQQGDAPPDGHVL